MKLIIEECKTFTPKLENEYVKSCHKDDYYCCSNETGPTFRSLDLNSESVFCANKRGDQNDGKKKNYGEYLLQAYMIKKAKNNGWMLCDKIKDWKLLDAERRFNNLSIPKVKRTPRRLDILAYSEKEKAYVILELKNAKKRCFGTAKKELMAYRKYLFEEIEGANYVYGSKIKMVKDIQVGVFQRI